MAADRRDDAELRKMSADGINPRGLLADDQVPGPMQHQATLLLWRLGRDEPHVWPGDRLANRLGVSSIVLVPLHIGLHIGLRHQTYGVAKRLELARPMMRRRAGLDTDQARRQLLEEDQYVASLELTTHDDIARRIDAVNLKNRLRYIQTDCRDGFHDLAPPNRGALTAPKSKALACRWRSRPQHQKLTVDGVER